MIDSISGFQVVQLKFSLESTAYHELFIKEHSVRQITEDKPLEKTLFVLNIPPYATKESIARVFSVAGKVKNVMFVEKPTSQNVENSDHYNYKDIKGFKVGYVVYEKKIGLLNALKLKTLEPLSVKDAPVICGLAKWKREYNAAIPDTKKLQSDIDGFMKKYDKDEEKRKRKEKLEGEPDDEGWITITKKTRKPGLSRKESVENKVKNKDKIARKKKELLNFYTFQIRESKMKHLAGLRQKFEEDKKKITLLKQSRRFKPF